MHRSLSLIYVMFVVLWLAGCGQPATTETVACEGMLLLNGQPLEVAGRDIGVGQVTLEFFPVDASGPAPQTYGAQADASGRFVMPGGIPPGKYKIAVRQWDPYPDNDKLQGKFAKETTPIVRKIDGNSPITIELTKPE